ncbi:hypothetical protein SI65_01994 [Aspergillus cristatus]|uniref:60S ribosome biogenesis protein Mak11 n=1 Tax=Aspergillus cristatus TaxID=573508 RepID=A0A1E3BTV0_ASPCR|nr:hypothetical protein SI65_01888 [Aspergillus cristatus]ODM24404.1 hypothetical protein SI65_01994 [Aspergillus cristatus]
MAKRKREETAKDVQSSDKSSKAIKPATSQESSFDPVITVQIVTGSYERVLHGFTAGVSATALTSKDTKESAVGSSQVQFADTFLFEAHSSAIRCLALSPAPKPDSTEPPRVILASGSTDERINLYSVSAAPPAVNDQYPSIPTLAGSKVLENPKNRELGSLLHHSASISGLHFPSRSKLLTCADDNTISISKTRDWTVVSTIKAPRPKVQGRPSGDTAPPGGSPSGVNDFAVHPSMKLMLSVGRGEKCMRLWNLVTGKKAGVLNFTREMLQSVKEGKWSSGEGRKIEWNSKGEEFAVAFEWGSVVFGIDSTPTCRVMPNPRSKLHQMKYVTVDPSSEDASDLLAISTEDGRVIFYSTKKLREPENDPDSSIPFAEPIAQLGGKANGLPGRIKDFEVFSLKDEPTVKKDAFLVVTANSDGAVRVWLVDGKELKKQNDSENAPTTSQVGKLLNTYETGNRITCMKAFVMLPAEDQSTLEDLDDEEDEESEEEESSDEESDAE